MKYIEVETPYGLQKYPAYGIGGFVKNIFKGLKDVAKKVAPILPLALSFAPGFQALSPLTRGIVSGLSSAAASKLSGADTDDAIRNAFLVGGTSMLPALIGGQKLTEGAKLSDVLSKDRGYLKGLFSGYQAPTVPSDLVPASDVSQNIYDPSTRATFDKFGQPAIDPKLASAYEQIGVSPERLSDFSQKFDAYKTAVPTADASTYYSDVYKKTIPLTERAKDFLGTTTGKIAATAVASPLIAAAFEDKEETKTPDSRTGEDLIEESPEKYLTMNLPGVGYYRRPGTRDLRLDDFELFSRTAAQGGIMSEAPKKYAMGSNPMNQFVPRNGLIPSMGEEGENGVSDNVKALLSPDEFVFTKQAVQAAGGGDVMAGAKRLMAQMKQLEARGAQMGIGKA